MKYLEVDVEKYKNVYANAINTVVYLDSILLIISNMDIMDPLKR